MRMNLNIPYLAVGRLSSNERDKWSNIKYGVQIAVPVPAVHEEKGVVSPNEEEIRWRFCVVQDLLWCRRTQTNTHLPSPLPPSPIPLPQLLPLLPPVQVRQQEVSEE